MNKKRALILIFITLFSVLIGLLGGQFLHRYNQLYKVCVSEAGVRVWPGDFFASGAVRAEFAPDSESFSVNEPGEYRIKLKSGLFTYKSTLIIEDTIPPQATAVAVYRPVGAVVVAEDFITDIRDATAVELSFTPYPAVSAASVEVEALMPMTFFDLDTSVAGHHEIPIFLRDLGGNESIVYAPLYLFEITPLVTVEAGSLPPALSDFVIGAGEAAFITDINRIDMAIPGEYAVSLSVYGGQYESSLHIIDTAPPLFATQDISGFAIQARQAADFILWYEDVSPVEFSFFNEPDLTYIGTQELTIIARDAGGNESRETATLTLRADNEAPVIRGAKDFDAQVGDNVAYMKQVVATDNNPEGLEFYVDQSNVNINVEGVYPITYIARDASGNETRVSVNLSVHPKLYDIDEIYARADEVLERILTEDMTEREKLWAIYRYNMNNIFFEPHSEKETWERAAYEGLFDKRGDCFVYFATAKVLLERAGIKHEDIEKVVTSRRHYWHLVDLGEGWYHFDTTPRSDHPTIFMWTDEELMEYSAQAGNSHRYDRDIYPMDGRVVN